MSMKRISRPKPVCVLSCLGLGCLLLLCTLVYRNAVPLSERLLRLGGGIVGDFAQRPIRAFAALAVLVILIWIGIGVSAIQERNSR